MATSVTSYVSHKSLMFLEYWRMCSDRPVCFCSFGGIVGTCLYVNSVVREKKVYGTSFMYCFGGCHSHSNRSKYIANCQVPKNKLASHGRRGRNRWLAVGSPIPLHPGAI